MDFSKTLQEFENRKAQILNREKNVIRQSNLMMGLCHNSLKAIKQTVLQHGFQNKANEVRFFKNVKPVIISEHLYFMKIRSLELSLDKFCQETNQTKITECLKREQRFIQENIEFCHYIKLGHTHFDGLYFTRPQGEFPIPKDNPIYNFEPEFSTSHSGLLAMVKATQKFLAYCHDRVGKESTSISLGTTLKWTKSKAALIELIYALYWDKAIEQGNANLNKIVSAFEGLFGVQLSNPYKIYTEIKSREKTKTKFLEELIHVMNTKINEIS